MTDGRRAAALRNYALAAFVVLIGATQLITWWAARSVERDFDARARQHLQRDVLHVERRVSDIESDLDTSADRLSRQLQRRTASDRLV
ncbi:MAG TPA: hypothetical protein VLU46_03905, partial [Thermoanaerobaculia bacterium]|nr:hypothetical protein [Thermoanaerobaculia bacterium]